MNGEPQTTLTQRLQPDDSPARPVLLEALLQEMGKVVIGREREIKLLLAALLTPGHVLIEDLPGTGKTTMIKAFAKVLDCRFARIQCTPDLLPSDVTGVSVFNPKTGEFSLRKGPVFTHLLLVDEINRALPRTQSCLLECMEEEQVSIDGETHPLPSPFMVLATQNPVEMEGTFPLPEAQLDRFLMIVRPGYPSPEEERLMLEKVGDRIPFDELGRLLEPAHIMALREKCRTVRAHESIAEYITALAAATRNRPEVAVGASPRASKALYKAAKAWAFLSGRDYVIPDDVKTLLPAVWSHRLILEPEARIRGTRAEQILQEIAGEVNLPEERVARS